MILLSIWHVELSKRPSFGRLIPDFDEVRGGFVIGLLRIRIGAATHEIDQFVGCIMGHASMCSGNHESSSSGRSPSNLWALQFKFGCNCVLSDFVQQKILSRETTFLAVCMFNMLLLRLKNHCSWLECAENHDEGEKQPEAYAMIRHISSLLHPVLEDCRRVSRTIRVKVHNHWKYATVDW